MIIRLLLLLVFALPTAALADFIAISEHVSYDSTINADGSVTYIHRIYPGEQFRDSAGTYVPVKVNWDIVGTSYVLDNGPWQMSLDTTTGIFRMQRGNHVLKSKLAAVGYYDTSLDSLHVLDQTPNPSFTRTDNHLDATDYFPAVTVRYTANTLGVKEYVSISQAGRDNIPTPASLGLNTATTRLVWATRMWVDSLNLNPKRAGQFLNWANSTEAGERIELKNAQDSTVMFFGMAEAWVPNVGGDTTQTSDIVPLVTRFVQRNGNYFMLVGAKVTDLAALPAGRIIFDPPTYHTAATDQWNRSLTASQNNATPTNATWQIGRIASPSFSSVEDSLKPNGDESVMNWSISTGGNGYAVIDEATPNTTDYIFSGSDNDTAQFAIEAPNFTVNFHKTDSVYTMIYLRSFLGSGDTVLVYVDTTANGTDDYFIHDTVVTSSGFVMNTKKLCNKSSASMWDSIRVQLILITTPSNQVQVSWFAFNSFHTKITSDGDEVREYVSPPTTIIRGNSFGDGYPIRPDSGYIYAFFPSGFGYVDSLFEWECYAVLKDADPDITGDLFTWINREEATKPWDAEGAKKTANTFNVADGDIYVEYTSGTHDAGADRNVYYPFQLPDTICGLWWNQAVEHDNGVMITWSQDSTSGTSRRQGYSLEDGRFPPYFEFFTTYYPADVQLGGVNPPEAIADTTMDTVWGYYRTTFEVSLAKDTANTALFDSSVIYIKPAGDTAYFAWWQYAGNTIAFLDTIPTSTYVFLIDTLGMDKWGVFPRVSVSGNAVWPNTHGVCSLRVEAFDNYGNGDTLYRAVYIDSSFWLSTTVDEATWIDSFAPTYNMGADQELRIGSGRRLLFRVDSLPTPTTVAKTELANVRRLLRLYQGSSGSDAITVEAARFDSTGWNEGASDSAAAAANEVSWDSMATGTAAWVTPGGDLDTDSLTDTTTLSVTGSSGADLITDLTHIIDGDSLNFALKLLKGPSNLTLFSDDTTSNLQPQIITAYRNEAARANNTAFWVRTGVKYVDITVSSYDHKDISITGMPDKPKVVIGLFAPAPAAGDGFQYPVLYTYFQAAERTSDGSVNLTWSTSASNVFNGGGQSGQTGFHSNTTGAMGGWNGGGGNLSGAPFFNGFTADGVNLTFWAYSWGGQFPRMALHYICIGGTEITNTDIVWGIDQNATASYNNTAVNWPSGPFQADVLFYHGGGSTYPYNWNWDNAWTGGLSSGFYDGTDSWFSMLHYYTAWGTSWHWGWSSADSLMQGDWFGQWGKTFQFTGITSTGFGFKTRRPTSTVGESTQWSVIGIKGGDWDVGSDSIPVVTEAAISTITTGTTNPSFVMFNTHSHHTFSGQDVEPQDATKPDTVNWGYSFSIGAYDNVSVDPWSVILRSYDSLNGLPATYPVPANSFHSTTYPISTYRQPVLSPAFLDESGIVSSFGTNAVNMAWIRQRGGADTGSFFGWVTAGADGVGPQPAEPEGRRRRIKMMLGEKEPKKNDEEVFADNRRTPATEWARALGVHCQQ